MYYGSEIECIDCIVHSHSVCALCPCVLVGKCFGPHEENSLYMQIWKYIYFFFFCICLKLADNLKIIVI